MPNDDWTFVGSEQIRAYNVLTLREDKYRLKRNGSETVFAVCDSADWVLVIPLTTDGDVVFVRQFRPGRAEEILEIPGGVMDNGETPAETAVRELREETGFVPTDVRICGPLLPNPAFNTARFHVAVASGCINASTKAPDPFEQIETDLRPLSSVSQMIAKGELNHALCIAAFAISGLEIA